MTPAALLFDSPADATVAMSREDVEAALRGPDHGLPRFTLGEPGTGVEDMQIDMCPVAPRAFELDSPGEVASQSAEAPVVESVDFDRTARVPREEIESALQGPAESPVASPEPEPEPEPERASEPAEPPIMAVEPEPMEAPAASLEPEPAAVVEAPAIAAPEFAPPEDLEGIIASFNARHVILFRAVRAEIGAGAANFVRSCRGALDNGSEDLFATADLRADGSWDPDGLKRSVIEHRIGNASEVFEKLLDGELLRLRAHLGEVKAAALADQLAAIF